MPDELLDLVNEKDEVIGQVWKSEAHKDPGKIHREVAIAVFNEKGEVLLQRRSMNKTNSPGVWQITSAGHVMSGEDTKEAAKREVFEELGFEVDPLLYTKEFWKSSQGTESRFFWIYYVVIKVKTKLILDDEEVMDVVWIKPAKIDEFMKNGNYVFDLKSKKMIFEMIKNLNI